MCARARMTVGWRRLHVCAGGGWLPHVVVTSLHVCTVHCGLLCSRALLPSSPHDVRIEPPLSAPPISHAIVSSAVGPEYYVSIMSFVDKSQLEPGCSVLLHNKHMSVVGLLSDEADPAVSVMKVRGGEGQVCACACACACAALV